MPTCEKRRSTVAELAGQPRYLFLPPRLIVTWKGRLMLPDISQTPTKPVSDVDDSSSSSPLRGLRPPRLVGESELACGYLAHGDLVRGLVEPRAEGRGHRCAGARTEAAALQRVRRGALR